MILKRRVTFKLWTFSNTTYDAEGNPVKVWTSTTATGDIQPIGNATRTMADFGKDTLSPDSRILYGESAQLSAIGYNTVIEYPTGTFYEVEGIAPWYMHSEILVQPYKGTAPA